MNSIPPDDPQRYLTVAESNAPEQAHLGVVGDTYTILLTGKDTAGRYSLIDMHVPPGGGRRPIGMTSRSRSRCSKARLRQCFAA